MEVLRVRAAMGEGRNAGGYSNNERWLDTLAAGAGGSRHIQINPGETAFRVSTPNANRPNASLLIRVLREARRPAYNRQHEANLDALEASSGSMH